MLSQNSRLIAIVLAALAFWGAVALKDWIQNRRNPFPTPPPDVPPALPQQATAGPAGGVGEGQDWWTQPVPLAGAQWGAGPQQPVYQPAPAVVSPEQRPDVIGWYITNWRLPAAQLVQLAQQHWGITRAQAQAALQAAKAEVARAQAGQP